LLLLLLSCALKVTEKLEAKTKTVRLSDSQKAGLTSLRRVSWQFCVYPNVSVLARVYLSSHTPSVPVEGLFSDARLAMNASRSAIASYRLNKKGQLSLTNPRDACEKFARFT